MKVDEYKEYFDEKETENPGGFARSGRFGSREHHFAISCSEITARLFMYAKESHLGIKKIEQDDDGRPHCLTGPAAVFSDGLAVYYVHGVEVPAIVIEDPDNFTKQEFMKYTNQETRRTIIEVIGQTRFALLLDMQVIDTSIINDAEYYLMETKEEDSVTRRKLKFIKVRCTSTEREYYIGVPYEIRDAHEGVAWTFGMSKEEYQPDMEA